MSVIYTHDRLNAFLVEYDFSSLNILIEKSSEEVIPFLTKRPQFKMYGKTCYMHRNIGFFSLDKNVEYKYSGQKTITNPIPPSLIELLEIINQLLDSNYNGVLVNMYETGDDYISAHSDNESNLDLTCGVLTLSCGTQRIFRLRSISDNSKKRPIVFDAITHDKHALLMKGLDFQKILTHEIPPRKNITDARISFTFRRHN